MKRALPVIAGVAFLVLLIGTVYWRRAMMAGLPPKTECANEAEAFWRAAALVQTQGGFVFAVLGTGSMSPYIRAHTADGEGGRLTVVAVVVTRHGEQFDDIRRGALCVYRPQSAPNEIWLHQAAQQDGDGWVMSGLNNARSESWMRVTRDNWLGTVAHTFTWP